MNWHFAKDETAMGKKHEEALKPTGDQACGNQDQHEASSSLHLTGKVSSDTTQSC